MLERIRVFTENSAFK